MPVSGFRSTLVLLTLMLCVLTLNASAAAKRKHSKPSPAKQEQPVPPATPVEALTPAELTLEQKPAVAPHVTYQNRQLTIVAENSTLGDILRAVKTQTGASIDFPSNANSRVVAHLGPGPSRDVLASLLNGTLFNYVLLGTVNDPSAVGKIILTQKPTGGEAQSAVNVPPNMTGQQQNYPVANMPGQSGDEQEPDSETEVEPPTDPSEQPASEAPNGQQQPGLRTPEQLLQELQRQQQLQQQMQQQQQGNPQQPNQVPQPNQPE